jgi:hypothetical protein
MPTLNALNPSTTDQDLRGRVMAKKVLKKGKNKASNSAPKPQAKAPTSAPAVPAPAKPAKKPAETKIKRGIAAAVDLPSVLVPFFVWIMIYLIGHGISKYDTSLFGVDLDRTLIFIVGGATLLFFIVTPVYRNRRQLTKGFAKAIIYGGTALSLVVCSLGLYTAGMWGTPVAEGTVTTGSMETVDLPGTSYTLFVRGHFPDKDKVQQEVEAEDAAAEQAKAEGKEPAKPRQTGSYKLGGPYELRLLTPESLDVVESYKGKFEQERQRRRVSKRGRGYLEVLHTTNTFDLRVDHPGQYQLQLALVSGDLLPKAEFAVYRDRRFPMVLALLGLICAFGFGLIDFLVRPLRVDSYFAPAIGIAYGFTTYFASTAIPMPNFSIMGVSLMVGAVGGGGSAYVMYIAANKLFEKIVRKYLWSLT